MSEVRTRFAPSPTGKLHLGGAHTALYCWLYARHHGGKFVLRIEDTDRERSTQDNVDLILDAMRWLELDWDEGPYYQSERNDSYTAAIEKLLENGTAYRCNCKAEDLEAKRQQAREEKRTYVYDGTCRYKNLGPDCGDHVIRFKMPQEGATVVEDTIKGTVSFPNNEMGDWIIARTDGSPTYNFCVVVDDAEMRISHVIRGDDHLNNTFKQVHVYKALGYDIPAFAHMPLMHGMDGAKLSKRHGATSTTAYRDLGFFPIAVRNYLARLGWAHGDQEIFTDEEMIKYFDIKDLSKSRSTFDVEKFEWVNAQHMKQMTPQQIAPFLLPLMKERGLDVEEGPWLYRLIELYTERAQTLIQMIEATAYLFKDEVELDEKPAKKFLTIGLLEPVERLRDELARLEPFTEETMKPVFEKLLADFDLKFGKIAQPVRIALTGTSVSPGIYETLELVGRDRSVKRMEKVIKYMRIRKEQNG